MVELNIVVQSIATMLGLGVGVDYSLIVIRRFIDEQNAGLDRRAALTATLRTAGRSVVASGTTVAAALATLLIIDMSVIRSMSVAAIIVVVLVILASTVVLPAVLYLLGHRVQAWPVPWLPRTRERARRRWAKLARMVMARPVAALAITTTALLALAAPALGLQTFNVDASVLPKSSSVRAGYDLVEEQFGQGAIEPILVVIESDQPFSGTADFGRLAAMTASFERLDHVARVVSPVPVLDAVNPADPLAVLDPSVFESLPTDTRAVVAHFVSADRKTVAIDVFSVERAGDSAVRALLSDVREVAADNAAPGWDVAVGGAAADGFAATGRISDATPVVIATMLAVIYVLLVVTFRSLLLPLKAIALNLLSVAATMGALVLIFQHGFLAGLLGIESVGPVQNFVPVLLNGVLFSLSTDYEVFLLSRVRNATTRPATTPRASSTGWWKRRR